jgi:hypothetical protein
LASRAFLDLTDDGLRLLDAPRPGDDAADQLVLGIDRRVVPPVPTLVIGRIVRIAVLLFLVNK